MKKLSFLVLILLISIGGLHAQKANKKIQYQVDENVPLAVLAAIEANQPGLNFQHQQQMAEAFMAKESKARKGKRINPVNPRGIYQAYQVSSSGKDYKKRELYTKEGKLIYSREMIRNTPLPLAIRQYIGREYNGWLVKRDMVITKVSRDGVKQKFYKVLVQNGKDKKLLRLTEEGLVFARK